MASLINNAVRGAILHQAPGIARCFVSDSEDGKELSTEGVNLHVSYNKCWQCHVLCVVHYTCVNVGVAKLEKISLEYGQKLCQKFDFLQIFRHFLKKKTKISI